MNAHDVRINSNFRQVDKDYLKELEKYFDNGIGLTIDKLCAFAKYAPMGEINKFIARYEIFKKILNINGSIVECGVFFGGGLMAWANFSSILEPLNHLRKIIGFDTFSGFPSINKEKDAEDAKEGDLSWESYEDLLKCIEVYNMFRPLGHIPKVELVKGNILETVDKYLSENKHLVISLLYLDVDLYEPTKVAIEKFLPRMPKGAIIAFDELNIKNWPGETLAVLDTIGINNLKIERFNFYPQISYAVLD